MLCIVLGERYGPSTWYDLVKTETSGGRRVRWEVMSPLIPRPWDQKQLKGKRETKQKQCITRGRQKPIKRKPKKKKKP